MFEFRKFCRVCTRAECILIDLFSMDENDNISFITKLSYCIPDIFTDNILPNLICESCCDNLKIAYSFKKTCLKTRRSLLKYATKFGPKLGNDLKDTDAPKLEMYNSQDAPKPELEDAPQLEPMLMKQEPVTGDEKRDNFIQSDELRVEDVFSDIIGKCIPETHTLNPEPVALQTSECIKCAKSLSSPKQNPICDQCELNAETSRSFECDVSLNDAQSLVAQENNMEFACVICKCVFVRMQHLQVHMRAHSAEKPYKCELCNDSFGWNHHLQRHMKMHCKENLSICTMCDKKFDTLEELQKHVKMHKNKTSPPPNTPPLTSANIAQLKYYSCPKCDKKFGKHANMLKHLWFHNKTHTTTSVINCEVCNREVRGKTQLEIHMRVHTGERPYACSVCLKRFTQKGYLTIHMRIHTGEKPYQCEVCGKHFAQTTLLRVHMKLHTGEETNKCPVCDVVLYNCTLRRHIELMHDWVDDL